MKTIDESGNIIENPDLEKGYLEPAKETVHHEAIEGVEEQYHQETIVEQLTAINETLKAKNTDSGTNGGEKT